MKGRCVDLQLCLPGCPPLCLSSHFSPFWERPFSALNTSGSYLPFRAQHKCFLLHEASLITLCTCSEWPVSGIGFRIRQPQARVQVLPAVRASPAVTLGLFPTCTMGMARAELTLGDGQENQTVRQHLSPECLAPTGVWNCCCFITVPAHACMYVQSCPTLL